MTTVPPTPGELIGDYEILDRIGGNMGFVFKARHLLLDKVVVLKLVPAECIADPALLARFQREIRVMGRLEHPNLVPAADARSMGNWHLVAMELIDGVDLYKLVRARGALPVAAACEAVRQAALGLQYVHEHGLIHRDIKPSNLMLTRAGTIKGIDMGLALIREDSTAQLTQTGLVLGTMSYCAPEQFRDASHVDIRADIYSLGCTFYHLLTSKSPYWQRKTFAEVMEAHLQEPFPSLAAALPDAPVGLEMLLSRMTAKDRDARFSTPKEVVEALEPFARGADLGPLVPEVPQESPPRRGTTGKTPPSPEGLRPAANGEQRPKARSPRMAAFVVLLLAIAGAAFISLNAPKGDPVVVLMDTTALDGIYDLDNRVGGGNNAQELKKVLLDVLPANLLHDEGINDKWAGEETVVARGPRLVIIHRSSFFHSYNAVLRFGLTHDGFASPPEDPRWAFLYNHIGEERLISLMGYLGTAAPHAHILIYSRGTDTNWLSTTFREAWVKGIEQRFPKLRNRITTMEIPGKKAGTFRDAATAAEMRSRVRKIFRLPEKAK